MTKQNTNTIWTVEKMRKTFSVMYLTLFDSFIQKQGKDIGY